MRYFNSILVFAFISLIFVSCSTKQKNSEKQQLIVFHAGSLSIPFKQIKTEFEKENPSAEILLESAGSVKCARKITDLNRKCDVMASADYSIIDELLIPNFASWNIKFASNEMAIVYHESSKYSDEINAQNWHKILLRDDVIFGRSDPNSDPCGYRAILTSQLAEDYYNHENLAIKILAKDQEYIRPKEVDLLALLESSSIDYIFLYRSVAQQHKLNYISLPDSINLKNPELFDLYSSAKVKITGKQPGTFITKKGQPMVYGITIPNNAPNKNLAINFVKFILSKKGAEIMRKNGQPSMIPSKSESYTNIPKELKEFANPE